MLFLLMLELFLACFYTMSHFSSFRNGKASPPKIIELTILLLDYHAGIILGMIL